MAIDPRLEAAARRIHDSRQARGRLAVPPADAALRDEGEGYAVQALIHTTAGAPLAGWKIGCTTPVMQRYLGIPQPCAGCIRMADVHEGPVTLPFDRFVGPGVECEIAVRIGRDLDGRGVLDRAAAHAALAAVMPAIELVDDRYADWRQTPVATLIADDFFQAGIVLGAPVAPAALPDLAGLTGRMIVDGAETGRGSGADILGHPLEAVLWLARHLAAAGAVLPAGAVVMCGSVVQTRWVARGETVRCDLGPLGAAEVRFA